MALPGLWPPPAQATSHCQSCPCGDESELGRQVYSLFYNWIFLATLTVLSCEDADWGLLLVIKGRP